jgi:hypothetical protein
MLNFGSILLGTALCVMGTWSSGYELSQIEPSGAFAARTIGKHRKVKMFEDVACFS